MTRIETLGLVLGSALLLSCEPAAAALPPANLANISEYSNYDEPVVQVVTRAGVAHRSARRTSRRVYRRHGY
ncbi:hypothetical protein [Methylocapsa acidiphila]|uniref:hypothetical protein n=1 Tax=Methylocapsa acidiphila TaxID=133552 RepID=UPI00041933DE|nr:hypothetical protein [Methylocapsa acidiphila]